MIFLRKRLVRRALAVFFLIVFAQSVFVPVDAFATTNGPHMPEYTSYEAPGATDMVNLATGDFSYSLPILDVPGPEGNFSVPLSYAGGIGLEQDASWVGLGWNMNVGSITRNINGYPDDSDGDAQVVTVQDPGVRGFNASIFGVGSFGWNSEVGHYGSVSLFYFSYGWGAASHVGFAGISISGSGSVGFDPIAFAFSLPGVIGLTGTLLSAGKGAVLPELGKHLGKGFMSGIPLSTASLIASGPSAAPASTDGYWKYSRRDKNTFFIVGNVNEYWIWLDQTRAEKMYGLMYLGNAPKESYTPPGSLNMDLKIGGVSKNFNKFSRSTDELNTGSASDITYGSSSVPYPETNGPVILAPDNFSVKAMGISGVIKPQRLELGSVSVPREMTPYHERLSPVSYLTNDASYKVPFVYKGQLSNNYFHQVGSATAVNTPSFYFGISADIAVNPVPKLTYNLNDIVFENQRTKATLPASKKIPQTNYVDWLTNSEIRNGITYTAKFMDFLSGGTTVSTTSERYLFRTKATANYATTSTSDFDHLAIPATPAIISFLQGATVTLKISSYLDTQGTSNGYYEFTGLTVTSVNTGTNTFRVPDASSYFPLENKPANIEIIITSSPILPNGMGGLNALGAYVITSADGTTYHFGLPVYDYAQTTEVRNITETGKRSVVKRNAPFANTWLLTGITGSDFVDRNQNGVIDDGDWGYWVKFNYGHYTSEYTWRIPRAGFMQETNGTHESYSGGKKQLIYLNSIETRSHVALFLKGNRTDAQSAGGSPVITPLRLEEIALVTKEDYNKLVTNYSLPEFSNKFTNLSLSTQFPAGSAIRNFLNLNCAKRIIFNYNYSLCNSPSTPNNGKLTLTSISILGRNNKKFAPDYKFEYANDPDYNQSSWDGFGMYSSVGNSSKAVSQANADAESSAWSLTKIIDPLGGETLVNYERDSYSEIAGRGIDGSPTFSFNNANTTVVNPFDVLGRKLAINHNNGLAVGDRVKITGQIAYTCKGTTYSYPLNAQNLTITSVTSTSIIVDQPYYEIVNHCGPLSVGQEIQLTSCSGTVQKYNYEKKGDGHRVASIVVKDEFNAEHKTRYIYKKSDDKYSSGVMLSEPERISANSSDPIPGAPASPVVYGRVVVLEGLLTNDNDYHTKQVYEFETPHPNQYTLSESKPYEMYPLGPNFVTLTQSRIEDRSAKVGNLLSLEVFDKNGVRYSSVKNTYSSDVLNNGANNYQGYYATGTLLFDVCEKNPADPLAFRKVTKTGRTTVIEYPCFLTSTTTMIDGFTSKQENLSWDFLTGTPDQVLSTNALGQRTKSVTTQAFRETAYAEMGSKADNINNKNMLSQISSTYHYAVDESGTTIGLLGAAAQIWRNDWSNYRYFNGTTYTDTPTEGISDQNKVWRTGPSYTWRGDYSRLQSNGMHAFSESDKFVIGGSNTLWQKNSEPTMFDHYGMPVEQKDMNGFYSATKMGYGNKTKIAEATNARYNEIAFSSAEDEISGLGYFGGEVAIKSAGGNAVVVRQSAGGVAHTGDCALSLSSGYGFVYKTTSLTINKTYKIRAWANSVNGRLYYKLNNGAEVLSQAPTKQGKAGWYLIELDVKPTGTFTSLEVGVKSFSGTVVFDDFRFQPANAQMVCYVQMPLTFEFIAGGNSVSYLLNNDNLYTKYETSENGLINKVYKESIQLGGEKLVSSDQTDYRRFHINP